MRVFPRHIVNLKPSFFREVIKAFMKGDLREGCQIEKFEKAFSKYIGTNYAIGVSQARLGLISILNMFGFEKGDEVILSAYNFHIIPEVVILSGLVPVFIDIEPRTYNINTDLVGEKINKKTRAIIVTHMSGCPADMDAIMRIAKENKLWVIEDCAHALGARYKGRKVGSFGDAAIFSFGHGKNMPCFGGGMITLNRKEIYREFKEQISSTGVPHLKDLFKQMAVTVFAYLCSNTPLFNCFIFPLIKAMCLFDFDIMDMEKRESLSDSAVTDRKHNAIGMANIQAIIGLKHLENLDYFNSVRRRNSRLLYDNLKGVSFIKLPSPSVEVEPVCLYYKLNLSNRELFRKQLFKKGIDTSKKDSMMDCSTMGHFKNDLSLCPVSRSLKGKLVQVPNNHFLNKDHMLYIVGSIKAALREVNK